MATDGFPDEPDAGRSAFDGTVDEAERESFPASDPPSSWAGADAVPGGRRSARSSVPVAPDREREKRAAAQAAAELVEDSMTVGLGTGSTVAHLLPALARRSLSIRCVATSPRTERIASRLGLRVEPFTCVRIDLAIDGADQIGPDGWLVKGGGGAHTREKVVAAAADVFVVIADSTKAVDALRPPIPIEVLAFGATSTFARIGAVRRRDGPPTPDGGVLADVVDGFDDPVVLAGVLDREPGVVGHGLFRPGLVRTVLIGRGDAVERIDYPSG